MIGPAHRASLAVALSDDREVYKTATKLEDRLPVNEGCGP